MTICRQHVNVIIVTTLPVVAQEVNKSEDIKSCSYSPSSTTYFTTARGHTHRHTHTQPHTHRTTQRHTLTQTHSHSQTHTQTDRETDRQTHTDAHAHTQTHTHTLATPPHGFLFPSCPCLKSLSLLLPQYLPIPATFLCSYTKLSSLPLSCSSLPFPPSLLLSFTLFLL